MHTCEHACPPLMRYLLANLAGVEAFDIQFGVVPRTVAPRVDLDGALDATDDDLFVLEFCTRKGGWVDGFGEDLLQNNRLWRDLTT